MTNTHRINKIAFYRSFAILIAKVMKVLCFYVYPTDAIKTGFLPSISKHAKHSIVMIDSEMIGVIIIRSFIQSVVCNSV